MTSSARQSKKLLSRIQDILSWNVPADHRIWDAVENDDYSEMTFEQLFSKCPDLFLIKGERFGSFPMIRDGRPFLEKVPTHTYLSFVYRTRLLRKSPLVGHAKISVWIQRGGSKKIMVNVLDRMFSSEVCMNGHGVKDSIHAKKKLLRKRLKELKARKNSLNV